MLILGIETSCDETACGIVDDQLNIRGQALYTQMQTHARFGGVVPEVAARAHLEKIVPVVRQALKDGSLSLKEIDCIAYVKGPGLLGPLLVGASYARALAFGAGIRAAGINHLEGHVASAFLAEKHLSPPLVALIVSGGHTELWFMPQYGEFQLLGRTRDDAAGEAFDKCGKLLNLGYPAGPMVAKEAENGDPKKIIFPQGMNQKGSLEFSFSGLKTSVARYWEKLSETEKKEKIADICAGLQESIVQILTRKALAAASRCGCKTLVVVGGVSANRRLREKMKEAAIGRGIQCVFPPPELSTDNGIMISAAAQLRQKAGLSLETTKVSPGLTLSD